MSSQAVSVRVTFITILISFLIGCGGGSRHKVHYTLVENQRSVPKKIVLLPVDVRVNEISAGGATEEVGEWSEKAKQNILNSVKTEVSKNNKFLIVEMAQLSEKETSVVEEHVALYERVYLSANYAASPATGPDWKDKVKKFEYSLGEGMSFLQEKTGADAALILVGQDHVSSDGRKAAIFLAAMAGVSIPLGHSFLTAGIVDLNSGDVLWIDHTFSGGNKDMREASDVDDMIKDIINNYPGIKSFKDSI